MVRIVLHPVASLIACALALAAGCGARVDPDATITATNAPLIYGDDDREEWYAVDDTRWRRLAASSSVAFIDRTLLAPAAHGTLTLPDDRYGELYDLCPGTRFAEQPAAAECSGVLIASDLVLTAAHCMRALPCEEWSLVFGYRYDAPERLHVIHERDVYACAGVVALEYTSEEDGTGVDYAVLQLDRAVTAEHEPAHLAAGDEPLARGAEVVVIGNGAGLPTKIEGGGKVADGRAEFMDYFVTDSDDFHGGSGSGVFNRSGALRGVVARGAEDYQSSVAGCEQVRIEPGGRKHAQEQITYAERALDGLCTSTRANTELCRSRLGQNSGCAVTAARTSAGGRGVPVSLVALGLLLLVSVRRRRRLPPSRGHPVQIRSAQSAR